MAWQFANFQRAKKLPDLKVALSRIRGPQKHTPKQMHAALQALSEQYGIPLRRTRLVKRG